MKIHSRLALLLLPWVLGCGAGAPVELRVDQFTFDIELDKVIQNGFSELVSQGFLPPGSEGFPALWPEELPDIRYSTALSSDPVPVDLSVGEDDPNFEEFQLINQLSSAINRIELNRFVLRVDRSNLNVRLPELELQVADDKNADPEDRFAWRTIGRIPGTPEPGFVGDIEFEYDVGGESFLNAQFGDDDKEFALRVRGTVNVDTEESPVRPSGLASMRMIAIMTFLVDPIELQKATAEIEESGGSIIPDGQE